MISFTKLFALPFVALALASATATAAPIEQRDFWDPAVLYPHTGTVWVRGQHHNVTWYVLARLHGELRGN